MKRTILSLAIMAAMLPSAVSCGSTAGLGSAAKKSNGTIRIVQYNIGAFSKELENSAPMIADMMREIKADAVCLNELDSCNGRHRVDQCKEFADEMGGWNCRFSRAMPYRGGAYGVGIVTPERIVRSFTIALPKGQGSEPRACCVVELDEYVLAATHLDYKHAPSMLEQARILTERLASEYSESGKLVILAGDMNSLPESEVIAELKKSWTVVSAQDFSFSSDKEYECIDYIMVLDNGAKYSVKSTAVLKKFASGDVTLASDHLPVYVDIKPARK